MRCLKVRKRSRIVGTIKNGQHRRRLMRLALKQDDKPRKKDESRKVTEKTLTIRNP
jgi:hypothetical protein